MTQHAAPETSPDILPSPAYWKDPAWRRAVLRDAFGRGFWMFVIMAAVAGATCWLVKGRAATLAALFSEGGMMVDLLPRVLLALSVASLIWVLLPRNRIAELFGSDRGIWALLIAAVAGMITPGGPSSAYALLALLAASGADRGALISYIAAWAILGLQRVLIWDVPFLGTDFALFRILICLPLPIIAGYIARALPLRVTLAGSAAAVGETRA